MQDRDTQFYSFITRVECWNDVEITLKRGHIKVIAPIGEPGLVYINHCISIWQKLRKELYPSSRLRLECNIRLRNGKLCRHAVRVFDP